MQGVDGDEEVVSTDGVVCIRGIPPRWELLQQKPSSMGALIHGEVGVRIGIEELGALVDDFLERVGGDAGGALGG